MIRLFLFSALFMACCGLSSVAQDVKQAEKKTLDVTLYMAIVKTLEGNPEVLSSLNDVQIAEENVDLARSDYRPSIALNGTLSHVQTDNDLANEWESSTSKNIGVDVSQSLYRGGRTDANIEEQAQLKHAAEEQYRAAVNNKILEVVFLYMAAYDALQALSVSEDNISRLQRRLEATEAGFEVGELTRTDISLAEAEVEQARAELSQAHAQFEIAKSSFREEVGIYDEVNMAYPELDLTHMPATVDQAIEVGMKYNPALMAAKRVLKSRVYNLREQEGGLYPEVGVNAALDMDRDPAFSMLDRQETASVAVTASLPIFQKGIIRNQVRQAKVLQEKAENDMEGVRRDMVDDIVQAWEQYQSSAKEIAAREAQWRAAKLAFEGIELEQTVGVRSLLDMLDANQEVRDAELALITAKSNRVEAYYQLLGVMGVLSQTVLDKSKTGL